MLGIEKEVNPKQKIAFLTDIPADTGSWIGRYFPWSKYLALSGYSVRAYLTTHDYDATRDTRVFDSGVELVSLGSPFFQKEEGTRKNYSTWALVQIGVGNVRRAIREIGRFRPDVIIVGKPLPVAFLASVWFRLFSHAQIILDCDDHELHTNTFKSPLQKYLIAFCERFAPHFAHRITTHTSHNEKRLLSYGIRKEKLAFLSNGVDPDRFENMPPPSPEGDPVILYAGDLNLDTGHNVDLLIQAFPHVLQKIPKAKLWMVGDGKHENRLKELSKELGINHAVSWFGRVTPMEVKKYFSEAHVIVDPVRETESNLSRCPLKVIEALYCGKKVVTSDVGDRKGILDGAGIVVRAGDAVAMAKGITDILRDPYLPKKNFEKFSWKNLAQLFQIQCLQGAT